MTSPRTLVLMRHAKAEGHASADELRVLAPSGRRQATAAGAAMAADGLRFDAALVSRLHCRLEAGEETLEVIDLASRNGTFVNDKRVDRARLTSGDRLRIGRVELNVEKAQNA